MLSTSVETSGRTPRVLVIDRGPQLEARMLAPLREAGCLSFAANDSSKALGLLGGVAPDVVLVHANVMASDGHDGLDDVLRHSALQGRPAVVVTPPSAPRSVFTRCAALGLVDCLLEPVGLAQFKERFTPSATNDSAPLPERLRSRTLVLAGEEGWALDAIHRFLAFNGFVVIRATSEAAALHALRTYACDAVVLCAPVDLVVLEATWGKLRGATALPLLPFTVRPDQPFPLDVEPVRLLQRLTQTVGYPLVNLCVDEVASAACPVEFRDPQKPQRGWSGLSFGLTSSALLARSLVCPRPGATLQLKLHLGAGELPVEGTGVVCWAHRGVVAAPHCHAAANFGVHLMGVAARDVARLRRWTDDFVARQCRSTDSTKGPHARRRPLHSDAENRPLRLRQRAGRVV